MAKTPKYVEWWIDSSIHAFLSDMTTPPFSMKFALLTCLDSCFDLRFLVDSSNVLDELSADGCFIGNGLLVKTRKLLSAERRQRIFFGFDEVWFFPAERDVEPKPEETCITGPGTMPEDLPVKLHPWMERTRCSLGLGDGTGLNFVAKLSGIARYLVHHLVESENLDAVDETIQCESRS